MPSFSRPWGQSVYEIWGDPSRPPLLLLNGLGYSRWSWSWQRGRLSELCALVLEHRGMGGSDLGPDTYSLGDLADDAAALLDELQLDQAVVWGVSLGGMVAQEFALRHPQRCRGLILGCTTHGGPEAPTMSAATLARMAALAQSNWDPQALRKALDLNFSPAWIDTNPAQVERFLQLRVSQLPTLEAWQRQAAAAQHFDTRERLSGHSGPALILHGDQDEVVPYANQKLLRRLLPQARSIDYPGARHLFWIEHAEQVNQEVQDFCRTL